MKILLIQSKGFINGAGGTEKVCTTLANHFVNNHKVFIACNENKQGNAFFELDYRIRLDNIYNPNIPYLKKKYIEKYKGNNLFQKIRYRIKRFAISIYNKLTCGFRSNDKIYEYNLKQQARHWCKYINTIKPDLIVTMSIGSLLEISYCQEYDIPIINSTNGRPDYDFSDILWYRSSQEMQHLRQAYAKLDAIQILFDEYQIYLPDTFKGFCRVIPNIVPQVSDENTVFHKKAEHKKIIMVARLDGGKSQNIAIDIFASLAKKYPNWTLHFWGDGEVEPMLRKQITEYGLSARIFLHGRTSEPLTKMKEGDIFIFPSQYEGFPLALTEAMSIGLPCLGFAYCSGVNELIKNGVNGFLAENKDEMAFQLEQLMQSFELRYKFGWQAHNDMKRYNKEIILEKWDKMIIDVMEKRSEKI